MCKGREEGKMRALFLYIMFYINYWLYVHEILYRDYKIVDFVLHYIIITIWNTMLGMFNN